MVLPKPPKRNILRLTVRGKNLGTTPKNKNTGNFGFPASKNMKRFINLTPDGEWAAAGLFKAGQLYYLLSKRSYLASDKQEALDIFERIVKRYPQSAYAKRASAETKKIVKTGSQKSISVQSSKSKRRSDGGGVSQREVNIMRQSSAYKKLPKEPKKTKIQGILAFLY